MNCSIRGDESAAELNTKARRLGQRERTYAKNRNAVLEYLKDGNFNNFVKHVRKSRCDMIQDDPILVQLWHEACVMKKVMCRLPIYNLNMCDYYMCYYYMCVYITYAHICNISM